MILLGPHGLRIIATEQIDGTLVLHIDTSALPAALARSIALYLNAQEIRT